MYFDVERINAFARKLKYVGIILTSSLLISANKFLRMATLSLIFLLLAISLANAQQKGFTLFYNVTATTHAVNAALGVESTATQPGALQSGALWFEDGYVWIHGGVGSAYLPAVLRFNPSTRLWATMKGNLTTNGVFGSMGISSANNVPPSTFGLMSVYIPGSRQLWTFGGSKAPSYYNSLFVFDMNSLTWTWKSGGNTSVAFGVGRYVTPPLVPAERIRGAMWNQGSTALWIFGGSSCDNINYDCVISRKVRNDLWKYTIANNSWQWVLNFFSSNFSK